MDTKNTNLFSFGKRNYQIMLLGLLVMAIGFIIMALDSEPYGYGFLGLTLGPLVLVVGFIIQFFAILAKPRKDA
ncbi:MULTISPECIES: DUF3098 domain-containing protein [Rufibacter]|uniref:Membrane-bound ClpP family serine protease n=1 Tax=Rufibacter quisquiliarum TaxID=1549639 RepID=A0A839GE32_9BACT|nr:MULTISPECIES: DUF3098 domain-containing protein [Rufibacter]MBA9077864.1 membrane-bound ClpP family serine protease [Rufibacter quisquiliarum]